MTYAMTETVAKLYPMRKDDKLALDRLFNSGPIDGECIHVGGQVLLAAFDAARELDRGAAHVDMGDLGAKRAVRKLHERRLCEDLANRPEPVLVEYSYEFRGSQKRKLMLSRGACELLATHFGEERVSGTRTPGISARQLAILKRSGGLVGEFHEREIPVLMDVSELLRQKIAAAKTATAA